MNPLVQLITYSMPILVVSIILALRYSKNLLNTDRELSPYRWGYFIGFSSLLSPVNSILLYFSGLTKEMGMTIFAPWEIISMAFTVLIGIGLVRRMRLGWWAFFVSLAISPFLFMRSFSTDADIQEALGQDVLVILYWVMGVSLLAYAIINGAYARKRWLEFMPVRQLLDRK